MRPVTVIADTLTFRIRRRIFELAGGASTRKQIRFLMDPIESRNLFWRKDFQPEAVHSASSLSANPKLACLRIDLRIESRLAAKPCESLRDPFSTIGETDSFGLIWWPIITMG